jgi:glycosyltransferase involved in cell wall biosynthesis
MKVLMVNAPASVHFHGGDTVQMQQTAAALRDFGVSASFSCDPEPRAPGFDLAHVFNLRTVDATARQVRSLKKTGLPIVLSPIYLNPSFAVWGTQAIRNIFSRPRPEPDLARLLEDLRSHKLTVKRPDGTLLTATGQNRTHPDSDRRQRLLLDDVAHLLPNSYAEMGQLMKTLRVGHVPFTVVPYGVDPGMFLDPDPELFVKEHALKDFVLQVGRIELSKNQLLLAWALRDLDLPLVLIGSNLQRDYLAWCHRHGPRRLLVLPHVPPEKLRSAYAAARVHVLPSWIETCGLVTLEAALANCSVVASIAGHELEYYSDLAYYCDPSDIWSIRRAVLEAYENYDSDEPWRRLLKEVILKQYTWERAAEFTYDAYCRVLDRRREVFAASSPEEPRRSEAPVRHP